VKAELAYETLTAAGVTFWTGVPDSLLKHFCAYITDHVPAERHVITANEGSAVALAAGHYIATGSLPLVYCQNSGLGNLVNPLLSLADRKVYSIPMVIMIGWRGQPGVKDEPQHEKQGEVMLAMLDAMGTPTHTLELSAGDEENAARLRKAAEDAVRISGPVAVAVPAKLFESHSLQKRPPDIGTLKREAAIEAIVDRLGESDVVVSTTGMISRELYELRERRNQGHHRDFLTVGSMGHCSQIALGVALRKPDRKVICLDGDGSVLMHMGGLATIGALAPANFVHIVLNNAAHDSVGGQPTVADRVDLPAIARACGYRHALCARDLPSDLEDALAHTGPVLLEVRVARGARSDLGRPKSSPLDNRRDLMEWLSR
jgi:phosphonopyruvate decarboxylase